MFTLWIVLAIILNYWCWQYVECMLTGKSDCSSNVSKPVICKFSNKSICKIINDRQVVNPVHESLVVNHCERAHKRSFNGSSHNHGVIKLLNVKNILMTSRYFYELVRFLSYFIRTFAMVMLIILLEVMSRGTTFPEIIW